MTNENPLTDAVQHVIQDYLAKHEGGGMVDSFVLVFGYIDADGKNIVISNNPADQKITATMGLIEWSRVAANIEAQRSLGKEV